MSTISLRCKHCEGVLDIEEGRDILFCPYCGSKELIPESDTVKIERIRTGAYRDVELGKQDAAKTIHAADLAQEQWLVDRKEKLNKRRLIGSLMAIIVSVLVSLGIVASENNRTEKERDYYSYLGYIQPPTNAAKLIGIDCETVMLEFSACGFENVEVVFVDGSKTASVSRVSINGKTDFYSSSWFPPDAMVLITCG